MSAHGAPIPMTSHKCTGLSGVVEVPAINPFPIAL